MSRIRRVHYRKLLFFLGALLLLFLCLTLVKNLLVSFLLAFVGYYLMAPFVDVFERRGLSRSLATLLPFLVITLAVVITAQLFLPLLLKQFGSLKGDLPRYIEGTQRLLHTAETGLNDLVPASSLEGISEQIQNKVVQWAKDIFDGLPEHISNSLTVLFLAPFLAFFMLIDGRDWVRQLLALVPNQFFELVLNLHHQISTQMGGFIRARLLESLIVGLLVALGLVIIGFPYALVLAVIAAVLNLIPYIGPIIGALPAFLIALVNDGGSSAYLWLTVIYVGAQIIDTIVIVPFLVAKIVNLHPVTVVLAVLVGSQMMGVLGMVISIPVASMLKVTLGAIYRHLTEFREES